MFNSPHPTQNGCKRSTDKILKIGALLELGVEEEAVLNTELGQSPSGFY